MRTRLPLLTLVAASVGVVALSGCSVIEDTLRQETSTHFDTTADMTEDWAKSATWVPADATDIRIRETTDADVAILRATTDSALPDECVETERRSGPSFTESWSGDAFTADEVWACGDWAVIPMDDGWYGWTPDHPDEKAASEKGVN